MHGVKHCRAPFRCWWLAALTAACAATARGDWDPGEACKWVQLPDLTVTGMDVKASQNLTLADDFRCTQTGPITNIHIWGSWYKDLLPDGNPANVTFYLAIYSDVPAMPQVPSHPGAKLWETLVTAGGFTVRRYAQDLQEGWYDPTQAAPYDPFGDTVCWQYNLRIPPQSAFIQEGTPQQPVIYWLRVEARQIPAQVQFGWKTSVNHWNDDAVWAVATEPIVWNELRYPVGSPRETESIDLAFVIGDESPTVAPEPKWRQPPDLSVLGMDVEDTAPILLADDFLCTNRTAITNIVVWGSWTSDILPEGNASNVVFTLSIHTDVPDPDGQGPAWSMPGHTLWWTTFTPGQFSVSAEKTGLQEGWFHPGTGIWTPNADTVCWRYEFPVDPATAFVQTGTVARPVIYWLDVQAQPLDAHARFGWKTSTSHWNDDACWAQGTEPCNGPWMEMRYPSPHPLYEQSIDLAFALYGGPFTETRDWGDAPDGQQGSGGTPYAYPTLQASNGARHKIDRTLFLGAAVDAEANGQPTLPADGDDLAGAPPDDEDGVVFTSILYAGVPASIQVTATGAGNLSAWLDGNSDGDWDDLSEQVVTDVWLTGGVTNLSFLVPAGAAGVSYMRFRYSRTAGLGVRGYAADGEVEDYLVSIQQLVPGVDDLDFGDAPVPYPTLLVQNGAAHAAVTGGLRMGPLLDTEANGQPNPQALGDDLVWLPDEDGVTWPTNALGQFCVVRGSNVLVNVWVSANGFLNAWADYNRDSDWSDANENVCGGVPVVAGANSVSVGAPADAKVGHSFARFRYSTVPVLPPTGFAPNGEVEDYAIVVCQSQPGNPANIVFTNISFLTLTGAVVRWQAESGLQTHVEFCTNLTIAATNVGVWSQIGPTAANQEYLDNSATNHTPSFYRIVAPYIWP